MPPPLYFGPHIIPQKQFGFGATQSQYCYVATQSKPIGFGPHIVPQRHYVIGSNQAKTHYGVGSSYSDFSCQLPPVYFNSELLETLKESVDITPLTLSSSVPIHTLLQLKQDLQLSLQNYPVNMPNPDIHLLIISDTNIT